MNRSIKLAGLVASVSVAAVVAGALVAAQQTPTLASASGGDVNPIDSTTSTTSKPSTTPSKSTESAPSGALKQTLDLTKLRQGAAPKTSYVDGRTVTVGTTKFLLPVSDGQVWGVARTGGGGALVLHRPNENGPDVLTTWSGGARKGSVKDVSTVRSAADQASSAYAIQPAKADGTPQPKFTLVWRDNPSGTTESLQRTGEHEPLILAVQGSEVYFAASDKNEKQTLYKWVAGDVVVQPVSGVPSPAAVSSDLQLAAAVTSVADDGSCSALIDLAEGKKRWTTCEYGVDELRGGSSFAVGGPAYQDGYGLGLVAALDIKTGKLVREWSGREAVTIVDFEQEDADHILVTAEQSGKTAIARCTPKTGACELATPLKKGTGNTDNRPYFLGT
ncbi:hypothetical protein ACFTSF_12520 [Kribbella sp. NPDC056951]|uniref:hypothetical protein n=1 Tax=Kribbella sp. NPDC056951 TaxID=3345978 RepID=UPI003634D1A3